MNNKVLYDFSGFRADTSQRCLWRGDDLVSLTPKAFETLLVLIRHKGNVVSKDSILDEVWKDTFVEEATLAQNISTLRKTLAKYDGEKEFIVTVPRVGYRFIADVTEINSDEEELIVEKRSFTHIVAEQREIHDSKDGADIAVRKRSSYFAADKKMLIALPLALIVLITAGIFAVLKFSELNSFYNSKFNNFRINTIYSGAHIENAAVSPDGRYVVVIERKPEGDSILLKPLSGGNTVEILPKTELQITGAEFSTDSDSVYYTAYQKKTSPGLREGKLYKIPVLGGASQEILSDIDSPVAISGKSKKLAFIRQKPSKKQSALIIADADGKNQKELAVRDLQSRFSNFGLSWSPDEKLISAAVYDAKDDKLPAKVLLVDAENGEQEILTEQDWFWIGKTAWLKDGSGIALVAYGTKSPNLTDEIWFISYPEGKARPITSGLKGVGGISLTDDLDSIVATKTNRITSSYVSPVDNLDAAEEIAKIANEESLLSLGVNWTPDKKIVYAKTTNGNSDIWIMDANGSNQKQLTSQTSADYAPLVSADGRYVFFLSNRNGATSIWRMGISGDNPVQITREKSVGSPSVSSKNDFIYYLKKAPEKTYGVLWRMDLNGVSPKKLTEYRTFSPKVSPDGKYIFCFYPDAEKDGEDFTQAVKFTILSAESGKVIKQFAPLKNNILPTVVWKQNSKEFFIVEIENGNSTLWQQNIEKDEPEKIKEWTNESVYQIAVSKDGEKIFFDKGEEVNSVIQLKNISGKN